MSEQMNTNTVKQVEMMDQLPKGIDPRAESPLYHAGFAEIAKSAPQKAGVCLKEEALHGHLVIRGNAEEGNFKATILKVLGLELPGKLQSSVNDTMRLCWISPDEWLLLLPGDECFNIEAALRKELDGHFAIVNVSGGQTVLKLSGEHVVDVLKKSTPYDVHDTNFPINKVVTSVFAKTQAVILRETQNDWALVVRRSFADYVWLWLQEAAHDEYGLKIEA